MHDVSSRRAGPPIVARRLERYLLPAGNMSLRGLSLVARFGLAIYLSQYLGFAELGVFSLVQGAAGIAPAVLGWGANYFLNREIVDLTRVEQGRLLRDRLILTGLSLAAALAVFAIAGAAGLVSAPRPIALVALIICLETFAFDIHMSMISLGKPIAANTLLFLRSAVWVLPAVVLGIYSPALRTLETVYWLWLGGLILNFAALWPVFRHWPLAEILVAPADVARLRRRVREGWLIYVNDVAIVGVLYLDRFVVSHFLGLEATGIFALYWSVANAIHVLVTTAVIQVSLPSLIRAYRNLGHAEWVSALRAEAVKIVAIGGPLLIAAFVVGDFVLPLVGFRQFATAPLLFAMMLTSVAVRLLADLCSYGLYSRGLDRQFALINILGVVASLGLSIGLIALWGLIGIGVAMMLTPLLLLAGRIGLLSRSAGLATERRPSAVR